MENKKKYKNKIKALLKAAKVASYATKRAEEFGIVIDGTVKVDFAKVMQRLRAKRLGFCFFSLSRFLFEALCALFLRYTLLFLWFENNRNKFWYLAVFVCLFRADISDHDACERFTKVYQMDVFLNKAEFIAENKIQLDDGTVLEFARCVIATGFVLVLFVLCFPFFIIICFGNAQFRNCKFSQFRNKKKNKNKNIPTTNKVDLQVFHQSKDYQMYLI